MRFCTKLLGCPWDDSSAVKKVSILMISFDQNYNLKFRAWIIYRAWISGYQKYEWGSIDKSYQMNAIGSLGACSRAPWNSGNVFIQIPNIFSINAEGVFFEI